MDIVYDEGNVIGLLHGTWNVADLAQTLLDMLPMRSTGTVVIADLAPEEIVGRCRAGSRLYSMLDVTPRHRGVRQCDEWVRSARRTLRVLSHGKDVLAPYVEAALA